MIGRYGPDQLNILLLILAVIFGLMNIAGLSLFLFGPGNCFWADIASMVIFGLAIGSLVCFLGGLMAVDIVSKKASGAALGVIGIASYIGAAIQDLISGFVIQSGKEGAGYDFSTAAWFWTGAAVLSVIFTAAVWKIASGRTGSGG